MEDLYFDHSKSKLYEMLKHCINTVPYYSELIKLELPSLDNFTYDFFKTLPILKKDSINNDSKKFISNTVDVQSLEVETTSGTQGLQLICYKSKAESLIYAQKLWRARRSIAPSLRPLDKMAQFYAVRTYSDSIITDSIFLKENKLYLSSFDLSEEKLEQYWNEILKFKPKFIWGPASSIVNLARVVEKNNLLNHKFELIEVTGEFISEETINWLKSTLNSPVANHYGSSEFWAIAYTCNYNNSHIFDQDVFVESIYNNKINDNELVITTMSNKSWPLVRYRIGDIGLVTNEKCKCGKEYTLLLKQGRSVEFFTIGGKTIHAILISSLTNIVNQTSNEYIIDQYQIVKDSESSMTLVLNLRNKDKESEVIMFYEKELRKLLGNDVIITFEIVDKILSDPKTGKVKTLIIK
ncbi:hypothetical protein Back11_39270 [Paenibacillus baekrokdamisoli]|uniref:Uncharacterized protein n=1 Tax=Paenibacillus baekrokdamisoli TaxID=1712516 RepID=A0A3G9IWB2_9BACL|nr:phenylacetate--CoA ligase family protein [Paenibacillus baekrokdamisoli]MBB3068373.1 phenylacetate-CoA ligase [Paenibacillus baekrokdamisoli]BBH22582.1 hypothetical protein Back11_39270 [Paenibacillus baekrokdamisoli]